MSTTPPPSPPDKSAPILQPGLVHALTSTYAAILKRQRTAASAFIRWTAPERRSHEFVWTEEEQETLCFTGRPMRIPSTHRIYERLHTLMATHTLNPYEKEVYLGYPYVLGTRNTIPFRAPLLTIPVMVTVERQTLIVTPKEEVLRFNSLPYRSEEDTALFEQALAQLIEHAPPLPLTPQTLQDFCKNAARELSLSIVGRLDGTLTTPPAGPITQPRLAVDDLAAIFIAPRTNYFLTQDLATIGGQSDDQVEETALGGLLGRRGATPTSDRLADSRDVYFPFSSNVSQRRVALLARDPTAKIITVQGPPGCGKSLTVCNVTCDLIANGKRVLICSQKDKALEVVDEMLRGLDLPQLPMTLLRQDRDSRDELRQRLESIQKSRSSEETATIQARDSAQHRSTVHADAKTADQLAASLSIEHLLEQAENTLAQTQGLLRRLKAQWTRWEIRRKAKQHATSDHLGETARTQRESLLASALKVLGAAAEHRTGEASRAERNQLREFSKLLGRNQTTYRNIPIFDRLKNDPLKCEMLLKILPCWILTPDDLARLFPCLPGLFDTIIVDEASQADLPSMVPALFRAKQAIVIGDSRQMQAARFAFTAGQVNAQAWHQYQLDRFDPDHWYDPAKIDLLQLASIRCDEEVMLNEHYRSVPPLIEFSNQKWYGGHLRLMRDHDDRRHGDPDKPAIQLHHVKDGQVPPGSQENEREAMAVIMFLRELMHHPAYSEASLGILCLFEQQARLLNDYVLEHIPEDWRNEHDLVVVNPDGFQGDERDVILVSLSYDNQGMEQSQISARQADREHIQGMLNVCFTRSREETHVFHTAPIEAFAMASGKGTILEWLQYCDGVAKGERITGVRTQPRAMSEFEAQVSQALQARGLTTTLQFPSCGYYIDVVVENDGRRIAVECDGEIYHLDESGNLRAEDCYRQEILERAGWTVLRIPYRGWINNPDLHLDRIIQALEPQPVETETETTTDASASGTGPALTVTKYEAALLTALRGPARQPEEVLRAALPHLGLSRLTAQTRRTLNDAITTLVNRQLVTIEEEELFPSEQARSASLTTVYTPSRSASPQRYRRNRYRRYGRRW